VNAAEPLVGVVMGSDSDLPIMQGAIDVLDRFSIPREVRVASAHRDPQGAFEYGKTARDRGLRVIIAGAGGAAHLAGLIAAVTTVPVIGIPVPLKNLDGLDSLLSTVQMPSGIPVATMAIGGGTNAGLMAVRILGTSDERLAAALVDHEASLRAAVVTKNERLGDV